MKIVQAKISLINAQAIVTADTGEYFSLDVRELDGAGRTQLIEDSKSGELAEYLDLVAYGSHNPDIKPLIDERIEAANDWEVVYDSATA